MATRHGHGRAKHMAVQYLWVQQVLEANRAKLTKINTDVNRADLLTKHLPRARMIEHLNRLGYHFPAGEPRGG